MENIGALAILLAFCFAVYAVIASLAGKWAKRPFLVISAERAVYSIWVLLTVAAGILIYALISGDYRLTYVTHYSNKAMPTIYKFTAWWGGQEGSLLLWSWLLSTYSVVAVWINRRRFRDMMPYVTAVLMSTLTFFLVLISFVESPFRVWMAGKGVVDAGDGQGLNPLLQYWTMVIHPPMLYLGYVGFAVPFAFAIASLITKQPGEAWIHTTRRWTLVTWLFQSSGILLGAGWAYAVLGWGGYWGWDPVENASLLPWITATAFLHSVMMQEKKGMMKVWNIVLVSTTFFLCIFGTFLTRSGIVSSVHAFAQSPLGKYFVVFLAIGIASTIYLILSRLDFLKSEAQLESVLSRESSFLFNNLILLASCFAVLWGTLFPVISEALTGEKISVDAPFFNKINVPIALGLMLLTGIGPLIAWRRSSMESLKRSFRIPAGGGIVVAGVLFGLGVRHFYALVSFALCAFVALTVIMEFWKGASAIRAKTHANLVAAWLPGAHGRGADVHRVHGQGVRSVGDRGGRAGRIGEPGALLAENRQHGSQRERQLHIRKADRRRKQRWSRTGNADAGAALLQGRQAAQLGGGDTPPDPRGSVSEFRRDVEQRRKSGAASLRLSAGLVHLGRLLGAVVRHADLPGA